MLIKPRIKLCHNIIQIDERTVCIGEIPERSFKLENVGADFLHLLDLLDGTRTLPRMMREFIRKFPESTEDDIVSSIAVLEERGLLDDAAEESRVLASEEMELYDRQMLMYSIFAPPGVSSFSYQERLKSKRVCVLGMGGWGTWVVQQLAMNGVGHIRIVDGDTVETSNLNRQILYRSDDVGTPKVEAARRHVAKLNPHVEVEGLFRFVPKDIAVIASLIKDADAVFLCWASLGYFLTGTGEEMVHQVCLERGVPLFEMSADPFDLSVGPVYLNDGTTPCYYCARTQIRASVVGEEAENGAINQARLERRFRNGTRTVNAWQTSPSLSIAAGIVADQAIKLLAGLEKPSLASHKFSLCLGDMSSKLETFERKVDCEWCGRDRGVREAV